MAEFLPAVTFVLDNEGGFSDSETDPGGATNHGISLRFLKSLPESHLRAYGLPTIVDVEVVKGITVEQAKVIYKAEFWDLAAFEQIRNQEVATYVFDMCVHHGINQGIKLLQRALWACHQSPYFVSDDGILGTKTLAAIGTCILYLMRCMMAERAGFMRYVASIHSKDSLDGWLKRCYHAPGG